MRHFIFIIPAMAIWASLSSCGTAKRLTEANTQISSLQASNTALQQQLAGYDSLKAANLEIVRRAEDCCTVSEAVQRNLRALNRALAEQGTSLREIREKANEALLEFAAADAQVTYKNGLVYISMNDQLLFNSGSANLNAGGKDALAVIADVINEHPRVKAIVVGNTDDSPVKSGFKDNWSLSTERANAVVRLLRDAYQVDPARLTAAGRGKYDPVAANDTPEGKAMNRRIDIILNPDLTNLWEVSAQ